LRQLANDLNSGRFGSRYTDLADGVGNYLDEDRNSADRTFSRWYKDLMAEEVVGAMRGGKELRLACLVQVSKNGQPGRANSPYRGIFVTEASSGRKEKSASYIFTASCPAKGNSDDIDKHISLEVDWQSSTNKGLPLLITKRWVSGLCFFDKYPRQDVVFP